MKPCILVIDMLNDFFKTPPLSLKKKRLSKKINDLVSYGREHKIPIIWIRQEYNSNLSDADLYMKKRHKKITIKGTGGEEIVKDLTMNKGEKIIVKKRFNAFFNTKLDSVLKKMKIDTLILAGINTHACIRETAIDAFQRDYNVIIAKECTTSWDIVHHNITLKYLKYRMDIDSVSNYTLKKKLT